MKQYPFFFGRKKLLYIGMEYLEVWEIKGARGIYIDKIGRFIIRRWEAAEDLMGQTPRQRNRRKWSPKEQDYIVYSMGLSSALRGRRHALQQGKKTFPTYQAVRQIFDDVVRGKIISGGQFRVDQLPAKTADALRQFGFIISRAKRPESQEAAVKISFLYADSKRGLNVGALLARETAISDRLIERLEGLYVWMSLFRAQEIILQNIETQANAVFGKLELRVRALSRHQAFSAGKTTDLQGKLMRDQLSGLTRELEPWGNIRPFNRWVELTLFDMDDAEGALAVEVGDYDLARKLLERINVSLEVKKQQRAIDDFLLKFGRDEILKRRYRCTGQYQQWLCELIREFLRLEPQEEKVGFREPVCGIALSFLEVAARELKGCRLRTFKQSLKEAHAAL